MICKMCQQEKQDVKFYKGFTWCKDCISKELNDYVDEIILDKAEYLLSINGYSNVNMDELYKSFFDKEATRGMSNSSKLGDYLKTINSLPQYKKYRYNVEIDSNQIENSLIKSLIIEENELLKKIKYAREDKDYGNYKNLIRALTDVTMLKQKELDRLPKETWKDMFSHYKMKIDGEFQDVVSTWRQRGEDIEDHKIYKIEKEIIEKPLQKIYIDISRDSNYPTKIYCDGIATIFKHRTIDMLVDYIYNTYKNDNVEVYVDNRTIGSSLIDFLNIKGMTVKSMKMVNSR